MWATHALPLFLSVVVALPASNTQPNSELEVRQGLAGLLSGLNLVNVPTILNTIPAVLDTATKVTSAATVVESSINAGTIAGTNVPVVIKALFNAVKPVATPTSLAQATSLVAAAKSAKNANSAPIQQSVLLNALLCKLNGITSPDFTAALAGTLGTVTSPLSLPDDSSFTSSCSSGIYSNLGGCSQPKYTTSLDKLKQAIYIPTGYDKNSDKKTVILSPGTGSTAIYQFPYNIGKLLASEPDVQVVYLNIPMNLLGDIQISAEYVAYALLYFYSKTGRKVSLVTWSQGSLDAQWAYKYFKCTRKVVEDHIAMSPDYHGTALAALLCPGGVLNGLACTPAIAQQFYQSKFVQTLRGPDNNPGEGSRSYVTTTTVYSATDEIVQPQIGNSASGFLPEGLAPTSNTFLQSACLGLLAGGIVSHEGVLYNGVAYALLLDALRHDGPGKFDRVKDSCANFVAPGLTLQDVINTEAILLLIAYNIATFNPKVATEPPIMSYAT